MSGADIGVSPMGYAAATDECIHGLGRVSACAVCSGHDTANPATDELSVSDVIEALGGAR